jgi:tetratricopeptide (TPR) repeat protein
VFDSLTQPTVSARQAIREADRCSAKRIRWASVAVSCAAIFIAAVSSGAVDETEIKVVADGIIGVVGESTPLDSPLVMQARALRGLRTDVIGEMFSAEEGGDLSFSVLAVPLPGGEGTGTVSLFIEMDGASFLQFNQSDLARLEVYVYALNERREITDYLAEVFAVDVERLGERIWQSGVEFIGRLALPPGTYELRILVRNFQSRASGLQTLTLAVPDFSAASATALTPLISEPEARDLWLPVRSWRTAGEEMADAYPLLALRQNLNPAAQPVLVVGRKSEILVPLAGVPAGPLAGKLLVSAAGDGDFSVLAEGELTVEGRTPSLSPGLEVLTVTASPPGIAPGSYRVRLAFSTASGQDLLSTPIDVILVGQETRERNLLWSDMRWLLGSAKTATEARVEEAPKRERRVAKDAQQARKALTDRYQELVSRLADTPHETVRGLLFEFESEALSGSVGARLESLHQAELAVADRLAASHRDMVVPLILLHEQMYERYRNRRLYTLLHHTRSLLEDFADLFVKVGGGPKNGARMLASLGGYLQESNLSGGSRRLFSRALEWDYNCAAARMGLASSLEKYGEYHSAIDHLEQLILVEPAYQEGRLRLALNLERVGLRRRARDLLETIVASEASGWVGGVAYQELGRIMLQTGELQRAAELLERSAEKLPEQSATLFLLGHAYDRLGRTDTALDRLARVRPERRSQRSERWVYDQWPQSQLEAAREHLLAMSDSVVADLPAVLATDGESR